METHKVILIITGILLTIILVMSIIIIYQIHKHEYNGLIFAGMLGIIIIVAILLVVNGFLSRPVKTPFSYESYYLNI